jgi:COP9 signalosome complex subunit 7
MLSTLDEWSSRCVSTLADLEKQIALVKANALKFHKEEQEWAAHVERLSEGKDGKMAERSGKEADKLVSDDASGKWGLGRKLGSGGSSKRGSGGTDVDDMDVDDDDEDGGEKRGKKRGFGTLGFGK